MHEVMVSFGFTVLQLVPRLFAVLHGVRLLDLELFPPCVQCHYSDREPDSPPGFKYLVTETCFPVGLSF